jgi:hypothetical protein
MCIRLVHQKIEWTDNDVGSAAAATHAGVGNVVVHSLFVTFTSAMVGGYGAPIIFGGIWLVSTIAVAVLGAASRRWKGQRERALVRMGACKPRTGTELLRQAAGYAYYSTILITAYTVHHLRRWWQKDGKGGKQGYAYRSRALYERASGTSNGGQ